MKVGISRMSNNNDHLLAVMEWELLGLPHDLASRIVMVYGRPRVERYLETPPQETTAKRQFQIDMRIGHN